MATAINGGSVIKINTEKTSVLVTTIIFPALTVASLKIDLRDLHFINKGLPAKYKFTITNVARTTPTIEANKMVIAVNPTETCHHTKIKIIKATEIKYQ